MTDDTTILPVPAGPDRLPTPLERLADIPEEEIWLQQQKSKRIEDVQKEMAGRTCAIVLVGAQTASRKWVIYEISKAWNDGRGVLGIRINKLLNNSGQA